jgi:hypothetical protein
MKSMTISLTTGAFSKRERASTKIDYRENSFGFPPYSEPWSMASFATDPKG